MLRQILVFVSYFLEVPRDDVQKVCFEGVGMSFFVEDALAEVGELVVLFFKGEERCERFCFIVGERVVKPVCVLECDEECAALDGVELVVEFCGYRAERD